MCTAEQSDPSATALPRMPLTGACLAVQLVRELLPIDRWSCEKSFGAMVVTGGQCYSPDIGRISDTGTGADVRDDERIQAPGVPGACAWT